MNNSVARTYPWNVSKLTFPLIYVDKDIEERVLQQILFAILSLFEEFMEILLSIMLTKKGFFHLATQYHLG